MPRGTWKRPLYDGRRLLDRIFKYRMIDPVTECWLWPERRRNTGGYGHLFFDHNGRKFVAPVHRLIAWLYLNYDGDPKLEVCHRCNVKACFNPAHLYLATSEQNKRDALRDGLIVGHKRGVGHYEARFSEDQIREIRRRAAAGESNAAMGREFGVNRATIRRIVVGLTWKHVTDDVVH